MIRRLAQLLILLSTLLMPLAMTFPAAAAAPPHGSTHSATAMKHCPDEGAMPDQTPGIAACPMACAGALLAAAGTAGKTAASRRAPCALEEPRALAGIDPEFADPPPRFF